MVAKCIVHMNITAELKAYWVTCFTYPCSNVESKCGLQEWCSGTYICHVAGIFLRGYVSNVKCKTVLVLTLLIALSSWGIFTNIIVVGTYVVTVWNIQVAVYWFFHFFIYLYIYFWLVYVVMWGRHAHCIISSHDQKCHVAPHFDHLDARNAVVPLMILLTSCYVDARTVVSC